MSKVKPSTVSDLANPPTNGSFSNKCHLIGRCDELGSSCVDGPDGPDRGCDELGFFLLDDSVVAALRDGSSSMDWVSSTAAQSPVSPPPMIMMSSFASFVFFK